MRTMHGIRILQIGAQKLGSNTFFPGIPDPPDNIAVSAVSQTSVNVEWDAGFRGMKGRLFNIQYRRADESSWSMLTIADTNTRTRQSAIIGGLQSDVNYVLRMSAISPVGASAATDNVYFSITGMVNILRFRKLLSCQPRVKVTSCFAYKVYQGTYNR